MTKRNEPGLSLLDIASLSEEVPVNDSFIRVHGISAQDGLAIFMRFPALAELAKGFNLMQFISLAPAAVAAIIATATGNKDDAEAEEAAAHIPLEVQFDIIEAVGRLTFKSGFGPFVERIMALASAANSANFSKGLAMKSQPPLKPSSPPDIPQT